MIASGPRPVPISSGPSFISLRFSERASSARGQRLHQWPRSPLADEGHDLAHDWVAFIFLGDRLQALGKMALRKKEQTVGAPQPMHVGARGTAPPQAHDIQTDQRALRSAEHEPIGNHVPRRARDTCDHRTLADAHELVDGGMTAEEDMILHLDMTAEDRIVCKGDVVSYQAIMPDMGAGHEDAAIANGRDAAAFLGAGIHADASPDVAGASNDKAGRPATIACRLRRRTERGEWIDDGARADRRVPGQMHVSDKSRAFADDHMGAYDAIRPDGRAGPDHRPFFDLGGRSDLSHRLHPTTSMAPTSASATVWFPTLASPRYHHIFFFRFFLVM